MRNAILALLLLLLAPLHPGAAPLPASEPYDEAKASAQVARILARLGDRAALPANQVFEGVTISPTSSAERYLRIMDEDFARALGVDCSHCHDPAAWQRDSRRKFGVTRDMWSMVYRINQDSLRKIEGLDRKARINCTTCHRGELKPARTLG